MRKIFTLFALLCALVLTAKAEIINGDCTETLQWSYNTDTKILTFTGIGGIPDNQLNKAPWDAYKKEIEQVVIPAGVTSIGDYNFHSCESLKEMHLPQSVTSIGQYTFVNCISMHYFTMGDAVTVIGSHAFSCCYSLTTLAIPNSSQDIKFEAFLWVPNVSYSDGRNLEDGDANGARWVNGYIEDDFVYTSSDKKVLVACSAIHGGEVVLDPAIETVEERALMNCHLMTSVIFGDNVKTIKSRAVVECPAVENISLGSGITTLESYSLSAKYLKTVRCKVIVPPTEISSYTFYGARLDLATLYVKEESVEAYKNANVWEDFGTITVDTEGIDNISTDTPANKIIRDGVVLIERNGHTYTTSGQEVK